MTYTFPRITAISLFLFLGVFTQAQSFSQEQLKLRLDSFWKQHPSQRHEGMTTRDVKKIDKYDRPDLAAEQDFYMTIDPSTLTVPSQQKYAVMQTVKNINSSRSVISTAIAGVTWQERGPDNFGGRTRAMMFDPTDSANGYKKVWAGGVAGGLWYNGDITNSATAWSSVNDFWTNMAITSIAYDPTDDSTFYVGTGEGWYNADAVRGQGVWKSTDAGQTWTQLSSTISSTFYYIQKLVVTPTGRVIVATRTSLRYSDNGGTSWSSALSGAFADIEIASNGDLYCSKGNAASSGAIYKSTNNGTSWSTITPSGAGTIRRVEIACAPSDSSIVYAVAGNTSYGVAWIKKTIDGGTNWTSLTIPVYQNNTSQDYTRNQSWYDLSLAVHPTNPAIIIAGGIDLHKTTDSGTTWSPISHWYGGYSKPYVHADQHNIAFRPGANNEAIFGNDGGVFYSTNVGSSSSPSFSQRVKGYNVTQFYSVALKDSIGSNYMLAGAQDNGSHQFKSAGIGPTTEVTGGDGAFCFIDQDNPTYQITSYVRNNWRRSTNGGTSFSNITNSSSGRFINPADYDDDANIIYAAAGSNQIYRVSGITGSISASTLTVGGSALGGVQASHIRCSPYSSNVLFVGNSSGGIYKVTSANASPVSTDIDASNDLPAGYISCIEVGASDSQLLVTYTNYGVTSVWETQNGGTSWQNKEGNLPNMPVRWALYNPNDRSQVMLATEVGVWSTDNLGAASVDWDPSNNGLANVRCDMLQIRASDNMVAIATHGRGAYTTDVFGDTSIVAAVALSSSEICAGAILIPTNSSRGNIKYYTWSITPSTISFVNGTDSSYEIPSIQFNDTGYYSIKLVCSDSLGTDLDSVTLTNVVNVLQTTSFRLWKQDFDTITTVPSSFLDSMWLLDYTSNYPWAIDSNFTTSGSTGPATDYSGSGNYLYAEATGATSGNKAYIETGCLEMPDTGYFSFQYHMYGSAIGTLSVEIDTGDGWFTWTQYAGAQQSSSTDDWKKGLYDLGSVKDFVPVAKLRLTATRGASWAGDIALDELEFKDELTLCETIIPSYCTPSGNSTSYNDGVYGVKIDTVEYTSSGANVDGSYTDNICIDTFTVSDTGFVLRVNAGNSYSNRVRAYIDYNNDGVFDTITEMVWYSTKVIGYRNDTINIPANGTLDTFLRMRIMADDDVTMDNNACATLSYGESQDFGLKIISSACIAVDLGPDTSQCDGAVVLDAGSATSYLWSTGATTRSLSVTTSGTYSVTVTDASGCTDSDSIDVSIYTSPTVNLGADTVQCGGSVVLSSGSFFPTYSWSTGSNDDTLSVTSTGTYSITVTDFNGCIARDTIDVIIGNAIVDLGADTTQCGGSVVLLAGSFSSYSWSTGAASSSITATTSGTYNVTVTDSNGCTDSDTISVTINSLPSVNLGTDTTQCGGSIVLSAGSFSSYSWSTGATSSSITATTSGTYSVTVSDANNCTDIDTIDVTINSLPTINLGADTTQCGGSVVLSAGSFSSYSWSTGATSSSVTATSSGTYSVTVTDANSCTNSDTIAVVIYTPPSVNLGADTTQCAGSVVLSAGSFSSYSWSTGATSSSITATSSGSYYVTITDANGCTAKDTISVTINSLPAINLGADTTQCGGSIVLSAGSFSSYSWSNGATSSSITATTSGTYSVTVMDANSCTNSDTIVVVVHTPPTVSLGADTTQCGGSIDLFTGSFTSYSWSTGATSSSITTTSTGTYSVTVTDGNGCTDSDSVDVVINSLPVVNLGADTTQCGGSIALHAGSYSSYNWSTGAVNSNILTTSSGTYSVIVIDANGCVGHDTIDVVIYSVPSVDLGADTALCGGAIVLSAGSFSGYSWSNGATSSSITTTNSGNYSVTITDANGCTDNDTIDVIIYSLPTADLGADTTQCGGSVVLSVGSFSSYNWNVGSTNNNYRATSTGAYSVTITDGNGCTDSDTIEVVIHTLPIVSLGIDTAQCGGSVDLSAGSFTDYSWSTGASSSSISVTSTGTYDVTVTDGSGCMDSDTIEVVVYSLPTVSLGEDSTQCGGAIDLSAGSFSSYVWNTGGTGSDLTVTSTGTYDVLVTDANGCIAKDTVDVVLHILDMSFLGADTTICVGELLDAKEGSSYSWNNGNSTQTIAISSSGNYKVTKLDVNNCTVSDSVDLTVINMPSASFTYDKNNELIATFNVDFTNSSTNEDSLSWSFGDGNISDLENPSHVYNSGSYTARLIAINECGADTVEQMIVHTAGVEELKYGDVRIYPNPASNKIMIVSEGAMNLKKVELYDLFGKIIMSEQNEGAQKQVVLNINTLASGTYFVSIETGSHKIIRKVVVAK